MKCSSCGRELEEGDEVIEVREGILGLRGFVSYDEDQVFCGTECLKRRFGPSGGRAIKLPRRVP